MKTVRERAKEYSLRDFDGYYAGREKALEEGYIAGSTEQKAIDIEKACKACENELRRLKTLLNESVGVPSNLISVGKSLSRIRNEMEEYK